MRFSAPRVVLAVIVAAIGVSFSVKLGMYAEADDAPGGVVIAAILLIGAVALGLWIALRPGRESSS